MHLRGAMQPIRFEPTTSCLQRTSDGAEADDYAVIGSMEPPIELPRNAGRSELRDRRLPAWRSGPPERAAIPQTGTARVLGRAGVPALGRAWRIRRAWSGAGVTERRLHVLDVRASRDEIAREGVAALVHRDRCDAGYYPGATGELVLPCRGERLAGSTPEHKPGSAASPESMLLNQLSEPRGHR